MPARPDTALASLLLTSRIVDAGAKPLTSREYWPLTERVGDLADLLGASAERVVADLGVSHEFAARLTRLFDAGTALALELERLEQQGLAALSPFDDAYPARLRQRLGGQAPPVLYAAGPVHLLSSSAIAVVGSRDVTDQGAAVAQDVARRVAVTVTRWFRGRPEASTNSR